MSLAKSFLVLAIAASAACEKSGDVPPPKEPELQQTPSEPEHPQAENWSTLVIESSPPGLAVELNGKPVGKTPLTLDKLKPGNYDVKYKDEANGDVTIPVELGEGEDRTVKHNVVPRADRPPPSNAKN